MSVKIISKRPHASVIKDTICRTCGAVLQYAPIDIKSRIVRDYAGGSDTHRYITCPACNNEVTV